MDLRKLDVKAAVEEGLTFNLKEPTDDVYDGIETDIEISIVGAGSRAYKAAKQHADARQKDFEKRHKNSSQEERDRVQEEINAELVSACITGWKNLQLDNKDLKFSKEAAKQVCIDFPFIMTQVMENMSKLGTMLKNLSSSSKSSAK